MNFAVLALPRSRTCWISRFLSNPGAVCLHEPSVWLSSISALDDLIGDPAIAGISDSMMTLHWRRLGGLRLVAVRRRFEDVMTSARRLGLDDPTSRDVVSRISAELGAVEALPGVLRLDYDDLGTPAGAGALYRHCRNEEMPPGWFEFWNPVHIEVDRHYHAAAIRANAAGIRTVYADALKLT